MSASKVVAAEALGTGLLLATVVGSGVMAERLSQGQVGLALLANSVATGAVLAALILALGPRFGAHFNPVVSLVAAASGGLGWRRVPALLLAQVVGAVVGVMVANLMFELAPVSASTHARTGAAQWLSEGVATFGLVLVVTAVARRPSLEAAVAVGGWVVGAYWFTGSTAFANPAVTLARACTDTFAGIRPADVPAFCAAQLVGAALAFGIARWLFTPTPEVES